MNTLKRIKQELRQRIPLANRIAPSSAERKRAARESRTDTILNGLMDHAWYSTTFRPAKGQTLAAHYSEIGSSKCYAPSPQLAGDDGRTLKPWAAELLLRLGIRIGAKPHRQLRTKDARGVEISTIAEHQKRKLAVVTAVMGGIDRLMPIYPEWLADADFYAVVDHEYPDAIGWTRVHADVEAADLRRRARYIKTHLPFYFSHYDAVLWIDSNIFPCVPPAQLLDALGVEGLDFATFQHPQRSSLVMEAAACMQLGKEDARTVFTHLRRLHEAAMPRGLPLFETNVMYLNPKATAVKNMCASWWREILLGSKRDQLSLPIAIDAHKELKWGFLKEASARASALFVIIRHEKM